MVAVMPGMFISLGMLLTDAAFWAKEWNEKNIILMKKTKRIDVKFWFLKIRLYWWMYIRVFKGEWWGLCGFNAVVTSYLTLGGFKVQYEMIITPSKGRFTRRWISMHVRVDFFVLYKLKKVVQLFSQCVAGSDLPPGEFKLQYEMFITPSKGIFTRRWILMHVQVDFLCCIN